MVDIATRMFNQNWKIDPIIRSLLDTDFYKILMNQFIFRNANEVTAKFKLINRSEDISLVELISEEELRDQLDQARNLSLSRGEATWLRGNHFYGNEMMFTPDYVRWLEQFALPEYNLTKKRIIKHKGLPQRNESPTLCTTHFSPGTALINLAVPNAYF